MDGGLVLPASLFDKLFDYQKTGMQWLLELHNQQCGGVLADEMGLGKTVQVVSFLAALEYSGKLPGPVIVVAPATVLKQWARHFQDWWPRFYVRILHHSSSSLEGEPAAKRRRQVSSKAPSPRRVVRDVVESKDPAVLVTSYEQVRRHQDVLLDKFEYVVLDEGSVRVGEHSKRRPAVEFSVCLAASLTLLLSVCVPRKATRFATRTPTSRSRANGSRRPAASLSRARRCRTT
jgi:SNF2 family DNA or RNA helicase